MNEYLNALSKNFSRRHIDIFFSEKQDLTQTGGSPPGLGCGCKEFYPAPRGLKYRRPASAESAHKHFKGSYTVCEGLPVSISASVIIA